MMVNLLLHLNGRVKNAVEATVAEAQKRVSARPRWSVARLSNGASTDVPMPAPQLARPMARPSRRLKKCSTISMAGRYIRPKPRPVIRPMVM